MQIMREIVLFSRKIYTAGTNFTRPPVVTVATNLNSAIVVDSSLNTKQGVVRKRLSEFSKMTNQINICSIFTLARNVLEIEKVIFLGIPCRLSIPWLIQV